MRLLYARDSWRILVLIHQVCGLSLLEALADYPELSTLYGNINTIPTLLSLLATANNFTYFAPTNSALESFLSGQPNNTQNATFEALVQYSLIKGGFPSISFTSEPQFVATYLNDSKYANVTGGQVVELIEQDGLQQAVSGNRNVSTLTTPDIVCDGGIIHIIDQAFHLPEETVNAISLAHLAYFVSILTQGGYLSSATNQYVHDVIDGTDVTYFIPNSAVALANFTAMAKTWSQDDLKNNFLYHVVPKHVVYSDNLKNGTTLTTAEGANITITTRGKDVFVNAANITSTNYLVSNGVIHVIDSLLDRFNTAAPPISSQSSTTAVGSTTATPTSTHIPAQTSTIGALGTASTLITQPAASHSNNQPLKIGLGAGLGGAAILALVAIAIFLLRRRRGPRAPPLSPVERGSGNWDGHSMSTAPDDPKRYFVNNGSVQMRETTHSTGMVPVTILEGQRGNSPSYYRDKEPTVPPRSPERVQNVDGYF